MNNTLLIITGVILAICAMTDISTIQKIQFYIRSTKAQIYNSLFPEKEVKEHYEEYPLRKYHKYLDMNTVFLKAESLIAPIKSIKFDKYRQIWDKYENKYIDNNIIELDNFSILTYNVWFDKHNYLNRREALLNIFKEKDASVICLQEVIMPFIEYLKEDKYIKKNYHISDSLFEPYNIVILSKLPMRFYYLQFPTNQNRYLVIGEVKVRSQETSRSIVFSTSHFESLNNADFRKDQMMRSFKVINDFKNAFIMGDFNIDEKLNKEELGNFDEVYTDAWKQWMENKNLKTEDGYTYYEDTSEPKQRLDYILYGNYGDFKLNNLEIVGKNKIKVDSNAKSSSVSTPSDHQGIFAEFKRKIN